MAPYVSSKCGVQGLLRGLQSDLRSIEANIKFTTVYPYFVQTPLASPIRMKMKLNMLNNMISPKQVAEGTVDGLRREKEHVFVPWDKEPFLRLLR